SSAFGSPRSSPESHPVAKIAFPQALELLRFALLELEPSDTPKLTHCARLHTPAFADWDPGHGDPRRQAGEAASPDHSDSGRPVLGEGGELELMRCGAC